MGTKNDPGKFDCYANAEPDEPMFVLLGRDRHAAFLVRVWALMRHREGEDEAVVLEALQCAAAMESHARAKGKDVSEARRAYEHVLLEASRHIDEHPKGYDEPCDCFACLSAADPDEE